MFLGLNTGLGQRPRECAVVSTQAVALLALAASRAANVWPLAGLVNYFRPPELRIPQGQQVMMWFSGMRGAMAFAMALRALDVFPRAHVAQISAPSNAPFVWGFALSMLVLSDFESTTYNVCA